MSIRSIGRAGRAAIAAFLIGFVALSCAFGQPVSVIETKLDNGLTVLMKPVHAAPVFTAQVWFKVGSRNEHNGITGISHLLEHMLFNSSKNFKKGEISDMIRKRGGIENAATWTDFTYYWQLLGSDNLEFSLKTLSERVGNAKLTDKEFANERTVVLSELQGDENDAGRVLYDQVRSTAFQASPYHWPTIGWQSDVENITGRQLRDYYQMYYHPNNATLVLVGDFEPNAALGLIKKYFGSKPSGPTPPKVYTVEPPQRGERMFVVRKQGTAQRTMFGYRVPAIGHPDTYALTVMDQILSAGRSCRLYQALVEKQLATDVFSDTGNSRDPSLYVLGANGRRGVTADQLENALLQQVEIVKTTLPTDQEMHAAKNQLEASLVFQNDSVSDQGEQLGYYNTITSYKYLDTLIPRLKAVTPEDVKRVANKYLNLESLTVGKFIPTDGSAAGGGGAGPAIGPRHRSSDVAWKQLASNYSAGMTASQANALRRARAAEAARQRKLQRNLLSVKRAIDKYVKQHPSASTSSAAKRAKPTRIVLDNGMVAIVQENHSNPTIAISGYTKAGGNFDPEGKKGTASLAAEMITRGTAKRTALELAQAPEFVGASIDTTVSTENLNFTAKSLSKDFALILDVLSDELKNSTFPADQLEQVRGGLLSELEQSKESPERQASRAFYNSVFPVGHPYHRLLVADAQAQMQAVTRDDLVSFYKTYYRPDTSIIVIAGDVKTPDAINAVKQYFGDWKAEGPAPKVTIPDTPPQTAPKNIVITMKDKSQVEIVFGHAMGMRRSSPDYYAARLMNQILGGGGAMGSILGDEIREHQGLVYDIYSTFDAGLGAGPWYAALGTNAKNVDKAIASLERLVKDFTAKGPTPKQYEQAREYLIGVFPIALETNEGMARTLLGAEFYGLGMDYIANYPKIYRSVTLQQVNAAAKKYLHPDAATQVIAGPY